MLYTLNLDINGFVLSIAHTNHDNIDIDLSQIDMKYLNAYKLEDGQLVLDESRKEQIISEETQQAKETEIAELKKALNDTDYIMAETFENVMALDNPVTFITEFIGILKQFKAEYSNVIENRKLWRQRIKELEK